MCRYFLNRAAVHLYDLADVRTLHFYILPLHVHTLWPVTYTYQIIEVEVYPSMDQSGPLRQQTLVMCLYDLPNPQFIACRLTHIVHHSASWLDHFGSIPQREGDSIGIVIIDEHRGDLEGHSLKHLGDHFVIDPGWVIIDDAPDSNWFIWWSQSTQIQRGFVAVCRCSKYKNYEPQNKGIWSRMNVNSNNKEGEPSNHLITQLSSSYS